MIRILAYVVAVAVVGACGYVLQFLFLAEPVGVSIIVAVVIASLTAALLVPWDNFKAWLCWKLGIGWELTADVRCVGHRGVWGDGRTYKAYRTYRNKQTGATRSILW